MLSNEPWKHWCSDCTHAMATKCSRWYFLAKSRGDAGPDSDIDVLVVLTDDDPHLRSSVRRLAARVSLEYDLLLSVRAVGHSQWNKLARYRFPIYQAIQSNGIDLTPSSD